MMNGQQLQICELLQRGVDRLIFGKSEDVAKWVAERLPEVVDGFAHPQAIGVMSDDGKRMIAGVVYSDYHPDAKTMQLHIAADSPMWARPEIIMALLAYPFMQIGVFKAWVAISEGNMKSLRATTHIGFKDEGVLIHQFGPGKHAVMRYMLRPDYLKMLESFGASK